MHTAIRNLVSLVLLLSLPCITAAQVDSRETASGNKKSVSAGQQKENKPKITDQFPTSAAEKSEEDLEIQRRVAKYTQWLVVVGVIQFVALIAQGVVFFFTLRSMSDTAQRQLRAYLCVPTTLLKFHKPDIPEVQVHIKNSGQTPAYDVRGWIHMWIENYPLRITLPQPPEGFQTSREVMGPGSVRIFVNLRDVPIAGKPLSLLGTSAGTIYVYGEVRYRDAFGFERYTKYRFIYGGREGVRKSEPDSKGVVTALLKPDSDGNESN